MVRACQFLFPLLLCMLNVVVGQTTISAVERYDPEVDSWEEMCGMNLNRSAVKACVVSGLSNVKDYTFHGHHSVCPHSDTDTTVF